VASPWVAGRRFGVRSALAAAAWMIPLLYIGLSLAGAADPWDSLIHGSDPTENAILALALPLFFVVLFARLVVAARQDADRAFGLLALAAGITGWGIGAGSIAATGPTTTVTYPAPGELWMLSGYLGMAAYLYLRPGRGGWLRSGAALEAVITFGGALCVSGILLTLPVAAGFARQGIPLLVAVLSPTLDLALVLVIAGQVLAGTRAASWAAVRVGVGFVVIGAGDTAMTLYMAQGTYGQGLVINACFSLGFWFLVSGAVAEPRPRTSPRRRMGSSLVTLFAAAAAVVVLVLRPEGTSGLILLVLSVTTLLAVGGRLLLALYEATGAAEAYRLSLTDDLTALPNRRALMKHLTERLAKQVPTSLVLLDLDGFKEINDTLGHTAGDAVLRVIATRLARSPSGACQVSRLGGDEFALVFDDVQGDAMVRTSHAIRALIRKPVDVDGIELSVDCSVGVAVTGAEPIGGLRDHKELLRRADIAMYQAKAGREGAEVYDPARDEFSRYRLQLSQELANGIAGGQLVVWYQPQVAARTGDVVSLEALVRWQHPTRGLVPPGDFLPVARRAGLMPMLTQTMIRAALNDAAAWHRAGLDVGLAVNVAPTELLSTPVMAALVTHVRQVGLPADHVVVEVTEDSFLAQPERALDVIMGLRGGGLQVSIDDYGTGFSSLAYLKSLPVHEIKIDQSFVRDLLVDPRARVIVTSTIELARGLDLRIVAEGVEDEEVARALADLGVDLLQGYHFARPMPADQVMSWIAERSARLPIVAPRAAREP
jgi:diguanylate cyclase (GGDEF)-like protein